STCSPTTPAGSPPRWSSSLRGRSCCGADPSETGPWDDPSRLLPRPAGLAPAGGRAGGPRRGIPPGHTSPRAPMVQHLLPGMYAPLGLVLGAPVSVLLGSLGRRGRRVAAAVLRSPVVHVLSHPVAAAVISTGALLALYLGP